MNRLDDAETERVQSRAKKTKTARYFNQDSDGEMDTGAFDIQSTNAPARS